MKAFEGQLSPNLLVWSSKWGWEGGSASRDGHLAFEMW